MFKIEEDTRSLYAESFRTIKTNIKYSYADKDKKVFLVTSAKPFEGKSTIASNLAVSFSLENKRVLLIDCDLRKPTVHKRFLLSGVIGLSDALIGESEFVDVIHNYKGMLDVMVAGTIPPNPAELLSSEAFDDLITELKLRYDYIILDTPPLIMLADAQILLTKVDGSILVVKSGKTKREDLTECKEIIDQVKGKLIGVVLNGVKDKQDGYYYYE